MKKIKKFDKRLEKDRRTSKGGEKGSKVIEGHRREEEKDRREDRRG